VIFILPSKIDQFDFENRIWTNLRHKSFITFLIFSFTSYDLFPPFVFSNTAARRSKIEP